MFKCFFASREWSLYAYGGIAILLILLGAQVLVAWGMNSWHRVFYDHIDKGSAMGAEEGTARMYALIFSVEYVWTWVVSWFNGIPVRSDPSFLSLMIPHALLSGMLGYMAKAWAFWWREAYTFYLLPQWVESGAELDTVSQRFQSDSYECFRNLESIGLQVARALGLLLVFLPQLWYLSKFIHAPFIDGFDVAFYDTQGIVDPDTIDEERYRMTKDGVLVINDDYIPGILMWLAIFANVVGVWVSYYIGRRLRPLHAQNRQVEGLYRSALEAAEYRRDVGSASILEFFIGMRLPYRRLWMQMTVFDTWADIFRQWMVVVPFIFVGPSIFEGAILLGVVMMAINCFQKIQDSISLVVHNWDRLMEITALMDRLRALEKSILDAQAGEGAPQKIAAE